MAESGNAQGRHEEGKLATPLHDAHRVTNDEPAGPTSTAAAAAASPSSSPPHLPNAGGGSVALDSPDSIPIRKSTSAVVQRAFHQKPTNANVTAAVNDDAVVKTIEKVRGTREYSKFKNDLSKLLVALEAAPQPDWLTQSQQLSQLQRCLHQYKDVVGTIELPNQLHFSKVMWRYLSPQNAMGVQRRAVEVMLVYLSYVGPAYPLSKDLMYLLPPVLQLLPHATIQVRNELLDMLETGIIRRIPADALRSSLQGLLAGLLPCLEEAETSPVHRRVMELLYFMLEKLFDCDVTAEASPVPQLSGRQLFFAYLWRMARDAPPVRSPALYVIKTLLLHEIQAPTDLSHQHREADESGSTSLRSVRPTATMEWVGGDDTVVVAALVNCIHDQKEKVVRMSLDILLLCCPIGGGGGGSVAGVVGGTAATESSIQGASAALESAPSSTTIRRPFRHLFSFHTTIVLVAAAVQLLGAARPTPSITRRVLQWLTVPPGHMEDDAGGSATAASAADSAGATAQSPVTYLQDVTSYIISQAFYTVVEHWKASPALAAAASPPVGDEWRKMQHLTPTSSSGSFSMQQACILDALNHAAVEMLNETPSSIIASPLYRSHPPASAAATTVLPRDGSLPASARASTPPLLCTPLVWMRALLFLFHYQSPHDGDQASAATLQPSAMADVETIEEEEADGDAAVFSFRCDEGAGTQPFVAHMAPLLIPSLCSLLAHLSSSSVAAAVPRHCYRAEVMSLLQCLPWRLFAHVDYSFLHTIEKAVQPVLYPAAPPVSSPASKPSNFMKLLGYPSVTYASRIEKELTNQSSQLAQTITAWASFMVEAAPEQPGAAQEYLLASVQWCGEAGRLLKRVAEVASGLIPLIESEEMVELEEEERASDRADSTDDSVEASGHSSALLLANFALLWRFACDTTQLIHQRLETVVTPILDGVLAAAGANAMVLTDFFSTLVTQMESVALHQIRDVAVELTRLRRQYLEVIDRSTFLSAHRVTMLYEYESMLLGLHGTTLRVTASLTQLHLRSQNLASRGVLVDVSSDEGVGTREKELAQQTLLWLSALCSGAVELPPIGGAARGTSFLSGAVHMILDMLHRRRGSLVSDVVYVALAPPRLSWDDSMDMAAATKSYFLTPIIQCLWEAVEGHTWEGPTITSTSGGWYNDDEDSIFSSATACSAAEQLLALVATSTVCAQVLDVLMCRTEPNIVCRRTIALLRLLSRHRQCFATSTCPSSTSSHPRRSISALYQEPDLLFSGFIWVLNWMVSCSPTLSFNDPLSCAAATGIITESTYRLSYAYFCTSIKQQISEILMPLFYSFLSNMSTGGEGRPHRDAAVAETISAVNASPGTASKTSCPMLTALLPVSPSSTTLAPVYSVDATPGVVPTLFCYRTIDAAEVVRYFIFLLQLPTAQEWVARAMDTPTPPQLMKLLQTLETQSRTVSPPSPGGKEVPPPHPQTFFEAMGCLTFSMTRQSLISLQFSLQSHRQTTAATTTTTTTAAATAGRSHRSLLMDGLFCLSRLLDLSQTGHQMQPRRSVAKIWLYTSAQALPLLQLAAEADMSAVQAMLLAHISGTVLYLDDIADLTTITATTVESCVAAGDDSLVSRHWRQHAFQMAGTGTFWQNQGINGLTSSTSATTNQHSSTTTTSTAGAGAACPSAVVAGERDSGASVLTELKRKAAPFFTNKQFYNLFVEVVLRSVKRCSGRDGVSAALSSDEAELLLDEEVLQLWLSFIVKMLPYLYSELVVAADVVIDAVLSAMEAVAPPAGFPMDPKSPPSASTVRIQVVCLSALEDLLHFLVHTASAADAEWCLMAQREREMMSWISTAFSSEDGKQAAMKQSMWQRSVILRPLHRHLFRMIAAVSRCLLRLRMPLDASNQVSLKATQHAVRILQLLHRVAGSEFLGAYINIWSRDLAADASQWRFYDRVNQEKLLAEGGERRSAQLSARLPYGSIELDASNSIRTPEKLSEAAMHQQQTLQRAACLLIEAVGVPFAELLTSVELLLQDLKKSATSSPREQQRQKPKTSASAMRDRVKDGPTVVLSTSQLMYFFSQLVHGRCAWMAVWRGTTASSSLGLSPSDAQAVVQVLALILTHYNPLPMDLTCLAFALYDVVAYAVEKEGSGPFHSSDPNGSSVSPTTPISAVPNYRSVANRCVIYQMKEYTFCLGRLLESFRVENGGSPPESAFSFLQTIAVLSPFLFSPVLVSLSGAGRVVDAAAQLFQRCLLPILRHAIQGPGEIKQPAASIMACAALRVLHSIIDATASDPNFTRRLHRDVLDLYFSPQFFDYSSGALHEWIVLLSKLAADRVFHSAICDRVVPSTGRLASMLMSHEEEAVLRATSLTQLSFYVLAMSHAQLRYADFRHFVQEQITYVIQRYSTSTIPSLVQLSKRKVVFQPIRALLRLQRVLLLSSTLDDFAMSLWPTILPEVMRAFAIQLPCNTAATFSEQNNSSSATLAKTLKNQKGGKGGIELGADIVAEVMSLQIEALKLMDLNYLLHPEYVLRHQWIFADHSRECIPLPNASLTQKWPAKALTDGGSGWSDDDPLVAPWALYSTPIIQSLVCGGSDGGGGRPFPIQQSKEGLVDMMQSMSAYHQRGGSDAVRGVSADRNGDSFGHSDDTEDDGGVICFSQTAMTTAAAASSLSSVPWPLRPSAMKRNSAMRRPLLYLPTSQCCRLRSIQPVAEAYLLALQCSVVDTKGERGSAASLAEVRRHFQSLLREWIGLFYHDVDVAVAQATVEMDFASADPDV